MRIKGISIIGLGYVGLTTGVCLASRGYYVVGVDIDKEKVRMINNVNPPFYEPGLEEMLREVVEKGLFEATTSYEKAIEDSDISFITVGTPSLPDGSINLDYVKKASKELGRALRVKKRKGMYHLVTVKSTVIPGTTRNIVGRIIERESELTLGDELGLAMNPEFLREGTAIRDALNPDRVVIGEYDRKSGDILENLWRTFYENRVPIVRTSLEAAELIKYASNALLAMKISFANLIARLCERIPGCDVVEVMNAVGMDHRINPSFLGAGLGFGGSCFPKDLKAIIKFAESLGCDPGLLKEVLKINEEQPYRAIALARKLIGDLKGAKVAVLGLAFKPGTDDMREAVSIKVVQALIREGAIVVVHDPVAMENARRIFGDLVEYARTVEDALRGADLAILVTEWDEFRRLKPKDFIKLMRNPALVDGRRIYDPEEFRKAGVKFAAIGLGS